MNWNDDRLDRLADEVTELRRHMDERFDALQRSMTITLAGILAAFTSVFLPTVF